MQKREYGENVNPLKLILYPAFFQRQEGRKTVFKKRKYIQRKEIGHG